MFINVQLEKKKERSIFAMKAVVLCRRKSLFCLSVRCQASSHVSFVSEELAELNTNSSSHTCPLFHTDLTERETLSTP